MKKVSFTKKAVAILAAVVMSVAVMPSVQVSAANVPSNPITANNIAETRITMTVGSAAFTVNGASQTSDAAAFIAEGRTMVPLRLTADALGAEVNFDGATQTVQVSLANTQNALTMQIGRPLPNDMGTPMIRDGRTFVPLRFVADNLGVNVEWDGATQTITIVGGANSAVLALPTINQQVAPSRISIPNRHILPTELSEWISDYETQGGPSTAEFEHLRLVNEFRVANGLHPLEISRELMMSARFTAQSMHDLGFFSHNHPVYGSNRSIGGLVFGVTSASGENIALATDALAAFEGFLLSPGHRENMLRGSYSHVGIGFYQGRWVQQFSNHASVSVVRAIENAETLHIGESGNVSFTFEANGLPDGHFRVSVETSRNFDLGVTVRPVTDSTGEIGVFVRDSIRMRPDFDLETFATTPNLPYETHDHVEIRDGIGTIILYVDATTDSVVSGSGLVFFSILAGIDHTWWSFEEAVSTSAHVPIIILP